MSMIKQDVINKFIMRLEKYKKCGWVKAGE